MFNHLLTVRWVGYLAMLAVPSAVAGGPAGSPDLTGSHFFFAEFQVADDPASGGKAWKDVGFEIVQGKKCGIAVAGHTNYGRKAITPWDDHRAHMPWVIFDPVSSRYHLYYQPTGKGQATDAPNRQDSERLAVAVAEKPEGPFLKPKLGLFKFYADPRTGFPKVSRENNIIIGWWPHSFSIVLDKDYPKVRKWYLSHVGPPDGAVLFYESQDGIHWTHVETKKIGSVGDQPSGWIHDPATKTYKYYLRQGTPRHIYLFESPDDLEYPWSGLSRETRKLVWGSPHDKAWYPPRDNPKNPGYEGEGARGGEQTYPMVVRKLGRLYLGWLVPFDNRNSSITAYLPPGTKWKQSISGKVALLHGTWVISSDGLRWERPFRSGDKYPYESVPAIAMGAHHKLVHRGGYMGSTPGSFFGPLTGDKEGNIAFDGGMIVQADWVYKDNRIYLYYAGHAGIHGDGWGCSGSDIGLATWDDYRIGGLKASSDQAFVISTKQPPAEPGTRLLLNAMANSPGGIRIELLGADFKPIPGYTAGDCNPFMGDAPAAAITWKGKSALPPTQPYHVKVQLGKSDMVYGFLPHDAAAGQ